MLPNASPAEQRAYQQGFLLGIKQPLGTGPNQKPAPPLAIRHDQTLLNAFEQGYRVGLQQPKTSRYHGLIPWARLRQLVWLMLVVLAGLLVVTLMAPGADNTTHATHRVTQAASAGVESVAAPQTSAIPSALDDFSLLTPAERLVLQQLLRAEGATDFPQSHHQLDMSLLIDTHGGWQNEPCRGIWVWPELDVNNSLWSSNLQFIWTFDDKKQYEQNIWHKTFFPPTIGQWEVLLLIDNIPRGYLMFYYGGRTLELLE